MPAASNAARVSAALLVSSISSPFVSSAMPTIPAMFTPRSARAVAIRASAPGRLSSLTVNHSVTGHLLVAGWYPAAADPMTDPLLAIPSIPTGVRTLDRAGGSHGNRDRDPERSERACLRLRDGVSRA